MLMSSGSTKSPTRTLHVTARPDSLIPPSVAMCEWQSMMPAVRCSLPPQSTTSVSAASSSFVPALWTAAIFPVGDHHAGVFQLAVRAVRPDGGVAEQNGLGLGRPVGPAERAERVGDVERRRLGGRVVPPVAGRGPATGGLGCVIDTATAGRRHLAPAAVRLRLGRPAVGRVGGDGVVVAVVVLVGLLVVRLRGGGPGGRQRAPTCRPAARAGRSRRRRSRRPTPGSPRRGARAGRP
jgi:hypothetical protein